MTNVSLIKEKMVSLFPNFTVYYLVTKLNVPENKKTAINEQKT